ncbi:Biotin transporter BioY [Corynebacterium occultum]|uniref:Biotin transporter n=1 Tax=Corynebacterium occultum TaxID=2675219 RepID=A0A6B8W8M1_9CORY|nr:biotin transporter BioY [Corynebacterium occultum]QGU07635.1 Biotin transporter BioY [Corynebacterium occultum]
MNNKRPSLAQDLAYIAVFAALIIVLAFVSIPIGTAGVPIVLQNAAVVLAGLVLGGRRGGLAATLFVGLGLIGLPVLAGGRTTLAALAGPTVGYILGYIVSATVAGLIAYRAPRKNRIGQVAVFTLAAVMGLLLQYLCGALGLVFRADLSIAEASLAQLPFIIPDLAKFALMVAIAVGVHSAFPDLLRRRSPRTSSQDEVRRGVTGAEPSGVQAH